MQTRSITNKLLKLIMMLLALLLVIPLKSFTRAEEVKGPVKLTFYNKEESFEGLSFDYWKIKDSPVAGDKEKLSLANEYEKMDRASLDGFFGPSKKTQASSKESPDISSLTIEGLDDGTYLFKLDEQSYKKLEKYIVPAFFLQVDDDLRKEVIPKLKEMTLQLNKLDKDDQKPLPGVEFELYQVKEEREDKLLKFVKEATSYRLAEDGDSKLITSSQGKIVLKGLEKDHEYYFKETKALEGYILIDEKTDNLALGQTITLVNEKVKDKKAKIKFIKVDEDDPKKHLPGAEFLVSKYDQEKKTFVALKDGKGEYILTSDKNGELVTRDLDFGTYQLTEIKAPKGYIKALEAIEFVIDDTSESQDAIQVKVITNKKKEKPPKDIVNTGDFKIYLFIGFGVILIILGLSLLRSKKKIN
ncbi:MAG: SpaA isopeptide-forming pilin-related protein [Tissierellia bacterium]|nr:SpaA isopeptide-forming pilin-related protein [Tissierellia bacterium]